MIKEPVPGVSRNVAACIIKGAEKKMLVKIKKTKNRFTAFIIKHYSYGGE